MRGFGFFEDNGESVQILPPLLRSNEPELQFEESRDEFPGRRRSHFVIR
jgi:hypothetical protein